MGLVVHQVAKNLRPRAAMGANQCNETRRIHLALRVIAPKINLRIAFNESHSLLHTLYS